MGDDVARDGVDFELAAAVGAGDVEWLVAKSHSESSLAIVRRALRNVTVAGCVVEGPDEDEDPADEGPAEEDVDEEDPPEVLDVAGAGYEGGKKVDEEGHAGDQDDDQDGQAEEEAHGRKYRAGLEVVQRVDIEARPAPTQYGGLSTARSQERERFGRDDRLCGMTLQVSPLRPQRRGLRSR